MIVLQGIGCNYVHSRGWNIERPEGTGNYLFIHIETPSEVLVNGKWQYMEPCFIMYKKDQPQFFHDYNGNKYIDSWIHFDYDKENEDHDCVEELIDMLGIPCGVPIVIYNTIELADLWHIADAEFHQNGEHRSELMDMKLRTLIYKFADIMHSESTTASKFNRYRKAFGELRNNIYSGNNAAALNDIAAIAESQNMSVSYFEHVYKELFGVPITKDIIKSRITYARFLLHSSNRSIQEIAEFCGYENVEHFTRQFKKTTGFTPSQYRITY